MCSIGRFPDFWSCFQSPFWWWYHYCLSYHMKIYLSSSLRTLGTYMQPICTANTSVLDLCSMFNCAVSLAFYLFGVIISNSIIRSISLLRRSDGWWWKSCWPNFPVSVSCIALNSFKVRNMDWIATMLRMPVFQCRLWHVQWFPFDLVTCSWWMRILGWVRIVVLSSCSDVIDKMEHPTLLCKREYTTYVNLASLERTNCESHRRYRSEAPTRCHSEGFL